MEKIENPMGKALGIRRELKEKESNFALLNMAKKKIENKESGKPLLKTPKDIFSEMENNNEIRGEYAKLEFLKLEEDDLAIAITDIHGDREKLQKVLDYIKIKKEETKGEIHLINMGDMASSGEDAEVLLDLLKGSRDNDYKLHLLKGNVERDASPATSMLKKIKETEKDTRSLSAMTDYFKSLPNSLFLQNAKQDTDMMFTHSSLPLVNKKKFEKQGLEIFNKSAKEIDRLGFREPSGVWATFDGEREKSEYGGEKGFRLGKNTFESINETLGTERIFRGHDSSLIKNKAKDIGVHKTILENGEVDTFHTSKKATGDFGVFAEITSDGKVEFKKV